MLSLFRAVGKAVKPGDHRHFVTQPISRSLRQQQSKQRYNNVAGTNLTARTVEAGVPLLAAQSMKSAATTTAVSQYKFLSRVRRHSIYYGRQSTPFGILLSFFRFLHPSSVQFFPQLFCKIYRSREGFKRLLPSSAFFESNFVLPSKCLFFSERFV